MKKIKVFFFPVEGQPEIKEVEDTLESYQKLVDGYIERYPLGYKDYFIFWNEEGLIKNLPLNPHVKAYAVRGNCFIVRCPGENMASVDENLFKKFTDNL